MGSQAEVSGPDLRVGIPLEDLAEGQPLLGHVGDDAVVLVRVGGEAFAVGATCTHWSGPLAEGIVTGDQIRCPWHHACFSLRTGAVTNPPALASLPRWETNIRDGRVFVGERLRDDGAPAAAKLPSPPTSVVIVGAGAAGMMAAETLRKEGYHGPIALIDPDADAPYDRPNLSKDFLAGNAPEEWLQLRAPDFYDEHDIDRVVDAVELINPQKRTVTLAGGNELPFGALLLAMGATPIRPPIPGGDLPHVHVLRSRADCTRLIAAFTNQPRVVIAGASFIGLEAAAALRQRGLDVTVVAPEAIPFARVLGDEIGGVLLARHEREGVRFRLGHTIKQINPGDVVLDNGDALDADLVLLGVGVRPVVAIAEAAGLRVDNGVLVDAHLETSEPGIFAAGDIARYPDRRSGELIRVEHWVVAERQGVAAARNLLGLREPFEGVPFFWTTQYDVTLSYVGHAAHWDAVQLNGSAAELDCTASYRTGDRVMAIATINRDRHSLHAEVAFEQQDESAIRRLAAASPAPAGVSAAQE